MGSITVIIILFILAIVGIKEFLIALAVGAILGMISAIIQSAEQRRENKYKQYHNSNVNNQSYKDNKEQSVNDNIIVIDMMDQKERERRSLEIDSFNWETDCESCEELLEDCECDWQDISKEDISQDDWKDDDSDNDGTSFDNFGG